MTLQPISDQLRCLASLLVLLGCLVGCTTISPFDQVAYEKSTSAKAEALALMDKATSTYASQRSEVERVSLEIEKAYEYDLGRNLNSETIHMWEILRAPQGNLFGGFLRRWREKGRLKPDAIAIKKPDIASAFDQISQLEIGKTKLKGSN